jgi:hypothetical protein
MAPGGHGEDRVVEMDLRNTVFTVVFDDVVLRPLLVNYANRLEHLQASAGTPVGTCFLRLTWPLDEPAPAAAGCEVVAAEVHVPRRSGPDDPFLDFILQRLHARLAGGPITARRLRTSSVTEDGVFDTIAKASTFAVAPRSLQHAAVGARRPARWTAWADVDATAAAELTGGQLNLN